VDLYIHSPIYLQGVVLINSVVDKLNRIQNLNIYKSQKHQYTLLHECFPLSTGHLLLDFSNMTFEKLNFFSSSSVREENFLLGWAHYRELALLMVHVNRLYSLFNTAFCAWYWSLAFHNGPI
jgi:hypothetical protein